MILPLLLCPLLATAVAADGDAEELVVEASSPAGPDPGATSATVTVIAVDDRLAASSDVASVLESAPGTSVVSLGGLGDFSAVSIRGSTLRQVQVYLDGVPLNPDGTDTVNLSELPLFAFDRVEVWRGGAPPIFAAAAIGGVVNLVTADRMPTSASASSGSWGTARTHATGGATGALAGHPADALVFAEALHTRGDFSYFADNGTIYDNFDDRFERRENNDKQQLAAHLRARVGDDGLRVTLLDAFLARDEGLPGHINASTDSARLSTLRNLTVVQADTGRGAWCATGRLWLLQREERLHDPDNELGVSVPELGTWFGTAGGLVHIAGLPTPWLGPSVTLTAREEQVVVADLDAGDVEEPRRRTGATAALGADLWLWGERVRLSPVLQGLLVDNRALGTVPFEETAVSPNSKDLLLAFTPRLGALVRPTPWLSLKANVGRNVRPPDLTELFGERGAVVGNTSLVEERGLGWDVGGRVVSPDGWLLRGALDVSHFWSRTEDLIVLVQNAQRTSIPVNFGLTWVQGLEAGLALDLGSWVSSQSSLTWSLSRNLTADPSVSGNPLPRVPALELWQSTSVGNDLVRVGHTWSYTDGNYWDATGWYRAAPRSLHGAFLRVQPGEAWPSAELSVLNLADHTTEVVPRDPLNADDGARRIDAITDFAGYPLPGRTFLFTLRWSA